MFSRLFKTPKSSLQLFRKNQAAMLPNDAESPQFPSENFSSLPIIWKVGLDNGKILKADCGFGLDDSKKLRCTFAQMLRCRGQSRPRNGVD